MEMYFFIYIYQVYVQCAKNQNKTPGIMHKNSFLKFHNYVFEVSYYNKKLLLENFVLINLYFPGLYTKTNIIP